MLTFFITKIPVKRKLILYANNPSLKDGLFNYYLQSFYTGIRIGFKRFPKYTKLINIADNRFTESFNKNTRWGIRKAIKSDIICETTNHLPSFIAAYNAFNKHRKLEGTITEKKLKIYGDALIVRMAYQKDSPIVVYHSYLLDRSIQRVRALHSVSNSWNPELNNEERSLIGCANRYLHYQDMLFFREQGFVTYDFGGYAYQTTDESLRGINNFKDSFGGILVEESNYESYPVYILKEMGKVLRKILNCYI
ncbi:MAG TPA: hypothetical protein ENK25_07120 [Bacteroidetes bacterium]|nr:hypothetical protein [Bacteroidota bacterium]